MSSPVNADVSMMRSEKLQMPGKPMPTPKPKPMPKKEIVDEVFQVVEQMPRFPACENMGLSEADRQKCSQDSLMAFIYANLVYPKAAKKAGIEGTCVVSFVIRKDGSITDMKIIRDPGAGCGEESVRVVKLMPKWIPGRRGNEAVDVQFNLPIRFRLE